MERGLYAIIDPEHTGAFDARSLARQVLEGGCAMMQLRAKAMPDRERLALALELRALARSHRVPFVINDRPDLAVLVEADGLHLGQDDLPIAAARRIVGAMRIGRSTHDFDQARRALDEGADLVAFGPVFPTASKERPDPVVGIEALRAIAGELPVPIVAIGGLDERNAEAVARAGAAYGAVISALARSNDPRATAARLHRVLVGGAR